MVERVFRGFVYTFSIISCICCMKVQDFGGTFKGLLNFSASNGEAQGEILLELDYSSDPSLYNRIDFRRAGGSVPPNAACTDGKLVFSFAAPAFPRSFIDPTGAKFGEAFSYRVCVYGNDGTLFSENTVPNVRAKDAEPPSPLLGLGGTTGIELGEVILSLNVPSDLNDYHEIVVVRKRGFEAPSEDCVTESTIVAVVESPFDVVEIKDLTDIAVGEFFSYRACVFDSSGNLATDDNSVAIGLKSKNNNPLSLDRFISRAGAVQGEIHVNIEFPEMIQNFGRVVVLRLFGTTPPFCDNAAATKIFESANPVDFVNSTVLDATGNNFGERFSYSGCVYDEANQLADFSTIVGARPADFNLPAALDVFQAAPGAKAGEIVLSFQLPMEVRNFGTINIRRRQGPTPPNADCMDSADGSGGITIGTISAFGQNNFDFLDSTGSPVTEFSYRACIQSTSSMLQASNVTTVTSGNHPSPAPLASFTAQGTQPGEITLSLTLPADISNPPYQVIQIRRTEGAVPPNADCTDGTPLPSITDFSQPTITVLDLGLAPDSSFSYRACIHSLFRLTSTNVVLDVSATPGS